jgi:CheY-like chemotaxis protein
MKDGVMTGERILIVEDDFLIRSALAEALADEGFQVAEAEDGESAMSRLGGGERFDLLLTDMNLGQGMDGLTLARCARDRSPDLAVIYTTGRADVLRDACTARDAVVAKPYLLSEVANAARRLLGGGTDGGGPLDGDRLRSGAHGR